MLPVGYEGMLAIEMRGHPSGKTVGENSSFLRHAGCTGQLRRRFETTVDEISRRFVEYGYDSVVYCRKSSYAGKVPKHHEGRRLVYVKGDSRRELDTFVSAFEAGWHVLRNHREYDYFFWFSNANLPRFLLTLLVGLPMSANTDGIEWCRARWTQPFKVYTCWLL